MKINILSLFLFASFLMGTFISCRKKDEHKIKVVFPYTIQCEIDQYIRKYKYMTIVYIDSTACTPCTFSGLTIWKHLRKNLEENDTGILFIIRNSDEQLVVNALKTHQLITIPFIFDTIGAFKENNKDFYLKNRIFVIDKHSNVIFTGSPIVNEKTWDSFVKLIK
jgi:hypothetical protein